MVQRQLPLLWGKGLPGISGKPHLAERLRVLQASGANISSVRWAGTQHAKAESLAWKRGEALALAACRGGWVLPALHQLGRGGAAGEPRSRSAPRHPCPSWAAARVEPVGPELHLLLISRTLINN